MNNKLKYLLTFLFIILFFAFLGIHYIAPYAILQPPRINGNLTPQRLNLKSDLLQLEVEPNLFLNGYWIQSKTNMVKGIIIIVHGVGGCKESYLHLSQKLAKKGVESIIFDGRAHGQSGGQFCTYGYHEKDDISKIVDYIKTKKPSIPIGVWGSSMGGAIALLSLEQDKRLQFGLVESTFTDLGQIVFDYKKRLAKGIGIRRLSDYAIKRAGILGNFKPEKVKPIEAVKNIKQPVIIAHGEVDKNITFRYGQLLFDNLQSTDKEFVLLKNGGHENMHVAGGKAYEARMIGFIERQLAD